MDKTLVNPGCCYSNCLEDSRTLKIYLHIVAWSEHWLGETNLILSWLMHLFCGFITRDKTSFSITCLLVSWICTICSMLFWLVEVHFLQWLHTFKHVVTLIVDTFHLFGIFDQQFDFVLGSVNVTAGSKEERMMLTGLHTVSDIFCVGCGSNIGWKYVKTS